jgi:hypothetical protein
VGYGEWVFIFLGTFPMQFLPYFSLLAYFRNGLYVQDLGFWKFEWTPNWWPWHISFTLIWIPNEEEKGKNCGQFRIQQIYPEDLIGVKCRII